MEKPKQIREVLTSCVPHLKTNPDKLHIFIAPGNVESTGASSLSFEWQYPLTIGVEDFAGHPDQIMVPLLAWLLSKLGLVTKTFFRKYRKHAVVVLLVLSAVITPTGDPFTLMIVFLPLYLLYELSIKIVRA
jgi:hypothetical protein